MRSILTAVTLLTRFPVPIRCDADEVGRAVRWFPLVGALLGAMVAATALGLAQAPRLPPVMGALLVVGLSGWATGAIHLDGLADTADGFGGGRTSEDGLRIMRDPRLGTFGVLALIFVVGLKIGALSALWERRALWRPLIASSVLGRWTPAALGMWLPYARVDGGVGRAATGPRDMEGLAVATGTTAIVSVLTVGIASLWLGGITLLITAAVGRAARRRIGGVTGDVFGAGIELTEAAVLAGAVFLTEPL